MSVTIEKETKSFIKFLRDHRCQTNTQLAQDLGWSRQRVRQAVLYGKVLDPEQLSYIRERLSMSKAMFLKLIGQFLDLTN